MATTLVHWLDNRNPSVTDTITVDGSALDLSSGTVKFQMRAVGSSTLKVDAAATFVTDGTDGQVQYDWAAADVDTAGQFVAWWEFTTGGLTQDTGEFIIEIREHAETSNWLCDVADIRLALELQHGEDSRLSTARDLITPASVAVMNWTEREFAPATSAATRTFTIQFGSRGPFVDFAPYDLRTATTVTLHPEDASSSTLTANTEYRLEPVPAEHSVYTKMRLYRGLGYSSTLWERLGRAQVSVLGNWGFASVPEPVRRATALTVAAWLDRPLAEYGSFVDDNVDSLTPTVATSLALPVAARRLLEPYKRMMVPSGV